LRVNFAHHQTRQLSKLLQTKRRQKTPSCTKDVWTCSAWGATCDLYGREQRTCQLSFDCPNVETPPPSESQSCQKLQCGNKSTLRDRISCRLNLAPAGAARDLELQYLPENCQPHTGSEQQRCVNRYKSFQPFVILGIVAGFFGQLFFRYKIWLSRIGGIFVILFGLFIWPRIDSFSHEHSNMTE